MPDALPPDGPRPHVAVGHVMLETDRMEDTAGFMQALGMRPVFIGPHLSVLELRGGTHLILMARPSVVAGTAPFDLMVDDLQATHAHLTAAGLAPGPIEPRPAIDHEVFTLREPAGHVITVFSSHTAGRAV